MCMETALPFGGEVAVSEQNGRWTIQADGHKLSVDEALWGDLTRSAKRAEITPGRVQFGLLPQTLGDLGRDIRLNKTNESLEISF